MANMDNGHDGAIFSEKDVKELSENLSRVFCKFVNTKIGDNHMLKKYINNYKALLQLPIFLEMQADIDRLKANLENDENEEHIKLEVEENVIENDGDGGDGGGDMGGSACRPPHKEVEEEEEVVEEVEEEEVEVTEEEEVEVTEEEEVEVTDEEEVVTDEEEVEVTEEEEVEVTEEEEVEVTEEEEVEVTEEEEVEVTDEEEVEVTDEEEGGHLPPDEEEGGHLPPEEEEEMYEWEDEESGNKYYTNDPDGESGDIYECLEDEDVGEHIGTITDGKISLF